MARRDERQCPRCKTSNLRASTNCLQCGAVMLGVDSADIVDILAQNARDRAEGQAHQPSTPGQDRPRPSRPRQEKPKGGRGCIGCLVQWFFWSTLLTVGLGYVAREYLPTLLRQVDVGPDARDFLRDLGVQVPDLDSALVPPASRVGAVGLSTPATDPTEDVQEDAVALDRLVPAVEPTEPEALDEAPSEVSLALRSATGRLIRCVTDQSPVLLREAMKVTVRYEIAIQEGRIQDEPRVVSPLPPPPWSACWQTVVQTLRIPASTTPGHFGLDVAIKPKKIRR